MICRNLVNSNCSMKYRWQLKPAQHGLMDTLKDGLGVSSLLARCLVNRGLTDLAETSRFLNPKLKELADPYLISGMDRLIDRLWQAKVDEETLVIFGDYDVDGVTATAILKEVFEVLGWSKIHAYLPHRLEEGYGLSKAGVKNCLERYRTKLILAVDCGSTSNESIAWLRKSGIDVLVLDHHQISDPPPDANVIVNPQMTKNGEARFHELCSAGLAFKVAHAMLKRAREADVQDAWTYDMKPLLDLVALGTIADLVPLIGENRILVSKGLKCLSKSRRPGVRALKEVAQIDGDVGVFEVGFQLGPRINAAGRLENAVDALDLLMETDDEDAMLVAQQLDSQNRERQKIERTISDEAIAQVRARFDPGRDFVIVEGDSNWHIGVVGIVASRVMREFYRPTIIIGGDHGEWRGSGRSIHGFDLAAALRECDDLLLRHGGHAMAAGLSVEPGRVDEFRARLNEIAARELKAETLRPILDLDAEVCLTEVTLEAIEDIAQLQPSGQANPKVQLVVRGVTHHRPPKRLGKEQQHAKFWITNGSQVGEAIWWACPEEEMPVGCFDLAFEPQINEFNGRRTILFKVLDWKPSEL